MEIEFTLDNQSLESLCNHYICNSKNHQKVILINSILMGIFQMPVENCLQNIFNISKELIAVEDNEMNLKQYRKNIFQLLEEIMKKYPQSLTKANSQKLFIISEQAITNAFCAVAGNAAIFLVYNLVSKSRTDVRVKILDIIDKKLLMDGKMICVSYRQITRQQLYYFIRQILKLKPTQQLNLEYITKIIKLVQDQKDPRNISLVFQIYQIILDKTPHPILSSIKAKLFQCLQMYYPIDFEGDTQKHKINLKTIAFQLDQCLADKLFKQETFQLLQIKMGAPPISKYVSLLILAFRQTFSANHQQFFLNLLLRTAEEQYLFEQYAEEKHSLADLIVHTLKNFVSKNNECLQEHIYEKLINWLKNLITDQVLDCDNNSKAAGVILEILQKIGCSDIPHSIVNVIAEYIIVDFVKICKSKEARGDILYKLGILVPLFQGPNYLIKCVVMNDIQKIGLIIMSLSHIFHTTDNEQQQPKLLCLKLLMVISQIKQQRYYKIIQQTNIIHYCIQFIKKPAIMQSTNKTVIVKSYIDFLVFINADKEPLKILEAITQVKDLNAKIYGLITLLIKDNQHLKKIQNALFALMTQQNYSSFCSSLESIKLKGCLDLCFKIQLEKLPSQYYTLIETILCEKYQKIKIKQEEEIEIMLEDMIMNKLPAKKLHLIFILRKFWRPYLINKPFLQALKRSLENNQQQFVSENCYLKTVCFFNCAIQCLAPTQSLISQIDKASQIYMAQRCCLLPIDCSIHNLENQLFLQILKNSTNTISPTIIAYLWQRQTSKKNENKEAETLLIPHIPVYYLKKQGNKILKHILGKEEGVQIIAKGMIDNLRIQSINQHVFPLALNQLSNSTTSTPVSRIIAINKILLITKNISQGNANVHSDKFDEQEERGLLKKLLLKEKNKILTALQKLLQHRKRLARQSSRHLFSVFTMFK